MPLDGDFINDTIGFNDIQQGGLGTCWFLAPLASLASKLPDPYNSQADRRAHAAFVLQKEYNNESMKSGGDFKFNFYRLGTWYTVSVDRYLPKYRRSRLSTTDEWWVPLAEKAYAAFNGSYDNIDGGHIPWALTELTGGIVVDINLNQAKIESMGGADEFRQFALKYLGKGALFCNANFNNRRGEKRNGLVEFHAYSLLGFETIETRQGKRQHLVRLRNPHGKFEWKGDWGDRSKKWNQAAYAKDKRRLLEKRDDGCFFMAFDDWIDQFETWSVSYSLDDRYISN